MWRFWSWHTRVLPPPYAHHKAACQSLYARTMLLYLVTLIFITVGPGFVMPKLADRSSCDTHYVHTFINYLLLQCNTWIFQSQLKLVVYKFFSELIWHNFCSSHTALICDVDFDDYILQLCDTKIGWLLNMWHLMRSRITRMAWFKLIKCQWSFSFIATMQYREIPMTNVIHWNSLQRY